MLNLIDEREFEGRRKDGFGQEERKGEFLWMGLSAFWRWDGTCIKRQWAPTRYLGIEVCCSVLLLVAKKLEAKKSNTQKKVVHMPQTTGSSMLIRHIPTYTGPTTPVSHSNVSV